MKLIQFAMNHPVGVLADFSILFAFIFSFPLAIPANRAVFLFKVYVCWLFFRGIASFWMASEHTNNLFLYNIDLPIQVVCMFFIFGSLIDKLITWQILTSIGVLFCAFFVIDLFTSNPNFSDWHHHRMNRYSHVVADGLMIILVLSFFWQLAVSLAVPNLVRYPFFWTACGMLVYGAGSVFLAPFYYYDNVWHSKLNLDVLQTIENGVVITRSLLFGIAMWQIKRTTHISPRPLSRQV
jgi:hypothetical protein